MSQLMFFTGAYAISVDGDYSRTPALRDLNVHDVGVVIPTTYIDSAGDGLRHNGFEVTVYDRKELRYVSYIFPTHAFASVDAFLTFVDAAVDTSQEILKKYTGWKKLNHYKDISPAVDILINETKIRKKVFDPTAVGTDIHVDLGNTIQNDIFTVGGDQSLSETYFYTL